LKSLIQKTWKEYAKYLHSLPQNKGKEIHHINSRVGVFLACKLLIVVLTKKQHEQEHRDHKIRTANMDLIREIRSCWDKRYGCMKIQSEKCLDCPLLSKEVRK
jgi:hypothetical protein